MNTQGNKNIFNESGCIRKELLIQYRDNKLSGKAQHEVEEHLVDCGLCSEALEGLALITSTRNIDSLKTDIDNLVNSKSSFVMKPWLAAAAVAGLVLFSYFSYIQFSNLKEEQMAVKNESVPVSDFSVHAPDNSVNASEPGSATNQVERSKIIPPAQSKEVTVQPNATTGLSGATRQESIKERNETFEPAMDQQSKTMKFEVQSAATNDVAPGSTAMKKTGNQNITFVDNAKVIDYNTYNEENTKQADVPRSTAPQYQNKEEAVAAAAESGAGKDQSRTPDYLEEVADPIILFNNGRYESANAGFDKLLMKNKNDQNAAFYKGLSLFHLKEFTEALKLLEPISRDQESPFMEEAKFYAAQSNISNGQIQKGKIMLEEISNSNGFYSRKADTELKNLKEK